MYSRFLANAKVIAVVDEYFADLSGSLNMVFFIFLFFEVAQPSFLYNITGTDSANQVLYDI